MWYDVERYVEAPAYGDDGAGRMATRNLCGPPRWIRQRSILVEPSRKGGIAGIPAEVNLAGAYFMLEHTPHPGRLRFALAPDAAWY